jgi:hypothetical protein
MNPIRSNLAEKPKPVENRASISQYSKIKPVIIGEKNKDSFKSAQSDQRQVAQSQLQVLKPAVVKQNSFNPSRLSLEKKSKLASSRP